MQDKITHGSPMARTQLVGSLSDRLRPAPGKAFDDELDRISGILAKACLDPAPETRAVALDSLQYIAGKLDDDSRLRLRTPAIIRLLAHPEIGMSRSGSGILQGRDSHAFGGVELLIELLRDERPANRIAAAETLAAIDRDEKQSAPALLQMTHDPKCREAAKRALRALGLAAPE